MKKFLKHIILFSLLVLVVTGSLLFYSVKQLNRDEYFRLQPAAGNVFLGYSHVQYSIIDSLIPDSRNLGMKGEAYLYTWLKARKIFANNPGIKNAFIEVSNKQVNAYMDSAIWQDYYLKPRVPRFLSMMDMEEFNLLFSKNKSGVLSGITDFPRQNLVALSRNGEDVMHRMEWGGYEPLPGERVQIELDRIAKAGYDEDTLNNALSPTNIHYLGKLVQLCRSHNIKVWFFRIPAHLRSGNRRNEAVFQQVLKTQFADIPFLDFIDLPIPQDEFYDLAHLNPKGSQHFSSFLGELFSNGYLEKTKQEQQQMVEAYWEAERQYFMKSSTLHPKPLSSHF